MTLRHLTEVRTSFLNLNGSLTVASRAHCLTCAWISEAYVADADAYSAGANHRTLHEGKIARVLPFPTTQPVVVTPPAKSASKPKKARKQ